MTRFVVATVGCALFGVGLIFKSNAVEVLGFIISIFSAGSRNEGR